MTRGTVINIHAYGASVRLEDGSLATIGAAELAANRPAYVASLERRSSLELAVDRSGRHPIARLEAATPAPARSGHALEVDSAFEERLGAYLKETEGSLPLERPAPSERHFIRKKRRAAIFEARNKST
ncbi:MAG: hypothetical protein IAI49_11640 [Candidatus Eremiobacteraeota bacterium]|nr:hypothetical protein [Candidatus Eremiobacteraeota bacterium]